MIITVNFFSLKDVHRGKLLQRRSARCEKNKPKVFLCNLYFISVAIQPWGHILWSSEKHERSCFVKLASLWSSLRIKFSNLRLEDFHYFRIFSLILHEQKIFRRNEDFFVGYRQFLFALTYFYQKKNKKKLKMAQNVRELDRIFG